MSEPRWNDAGTRPLTRGTPESYPGSRTRHGRAPADYGRQPPAGRTPRWGALPARRGIVLVVSGAAIGTVITVLTGGEPGSALGFFLVVATLAASFAVQPRAVYLIIPVPALAYLAGALVAGLIHDRAAGTTRTALAIGAAQWTAHGFVAMSIATLLVILIGAIRWGLLWRHYGAIGGSSAFVSRSAPSLRGTGSPRTTGSLRTTGNPRSTGSPRTTGGPRTTGNPRSTGSPTRPPNAGGTGSGRPRNGPPSQGY